MEIKDIIKCRRKELGLTMLDVAKVCEVSEATVSRWESGDINDMKRSRISLLAKVLNISPAIIVGTNDEKNDMYDVHFNNNSKSFDFYKNIKERDRFILLYEKTKGLAPKDLEQILKIIDTFTKEVL